jgi:S-adenosylmethionine-diacylgycerolhomoserine-N-methlytransferase
MATTYINEHGHLMDRVYRWQRHFYDATRKFYLLGRDRLIDELDVPHGGTVLEIGCGTGRNLVKIAERWPDCRIYGVDISNEMLKSATANINRHDLERRIEIGLGDATAFDPTELFGRSRFDCIVCSYTLSMIPEWQAALRWAMTLIAPQGRMHIIDFGMQENMPPMFRYMLFAWLSLFHVSPREELNSYAATLSKTLGWGFEDERLFRDYSRIIKIG